MNKVICICIYLVFTVSAVLAIPGQIITSFDCPYHFPAGLTFDGANLWLADHKADRLTCLDPQTGTIIRELPSPGFWPAGLAWDGAALWNIDARQNKIFRINPQNGTVINTLDAPAEGCEGLAWDGKTLWVSCVREKKLFKLDLSDGTAIAAFAAPASAPQGLVFDGAWLWCSDRLTDEIYMLNPANCDVMMILKSPGPYPRGLAWNGKYLYNVDYQTDKIYRLVYDDGEQYSLCDTRSARVTYTHEVKTTGKGLLHKMNVYLAIPESAPQQEINSIQFSPAHNGQVKDKWQQRFTHFQYHNVPADSLLQTIMTVNTAISAITWYIFPDKVGPLSAIPQAIREKYTANGSKYCIDDPYIQNLAREIVGEEKNPCFIVRKIFDHVRTSLEYKLEGGWNNAPVVLQRGTGSCSEYSFSFIALCRAAGLPARYVGAIVVRGDDASQDDTFHRWPEVYLPNYGWIPIDPQGGDKESSRDRAMNIGRLSNRFLVTTTGGGDSEYIGWYYNSLENWSCDPQVQVNIETFGEWEPVQ